MKFKKSTRGFTLIELAVSVMVLAVLMALLLMAVQSARGALRRTACANNIRQIGIATSNYLSMYGCYPRGSSGNGYSLYVMLLPSMDHVNTYNSINQSVPVSLSPLGQANSTAACTELSVLQCPADMIQGSSSGTPLAGTSYAGSRGLERRTNADNGLFAFFADKPVTISAVSDGTSTTAAVTEWVSGPRGVAIRDARGTIFDLPGVLNGPSKFDQFVHECEGGVSSNWAISSNNKGENWLFGGYVQTLYNHVIRINGNSCINQGFTQEGAYSAGSLHPGGVNLLFADGHVQFVRDGVAKGVWWALGTRDGGETISQDFN